MLEKKILRSEKALKAWRTRCYTCEEPVVVTNGVFDLLHAGHVAYLEEAAEMGQWLLVGINSDASVRALKGPTRPLNCQEHRALVVAALESVDAVYIFDEPRATHFLSIAVPFVYTKGGDYCLDTLWPAERGALEAAGSKICFVPFKHKVSTTSILAKV